MMLELVFLQQRDTLIHIVEISLAINIERFSLGFYCKTIIFQGTNRAVAWHHVIRQGGLNLTYVLDGNHICIWLFQQRN